MLKFPFHISMHKCTDTKLCDASLPYENAKKLDCLVENEIDLEWQKFHFLLSISVASKKKLSKQDV